METALGYYPLPLVAADYLLGAIMWTLIGRAVLDIFMPPESEMVLAKVFRQITAPFVRLLKPLTPPFLMPRIFVPLYVAWWFYFVRFFVIPYFYFGEWGMLSFPLESAIGQWIGSLE